MTASIGAGDGPSLETYLETRFNLLQVSIDKLEAALRERIDAVEAEGALHNEHLESQIAHTKQMLGAAQDNAKLQSDRAEKTQHDINIASNEWRATLNDFRGSVPSKDELNRFYSEFIAYKLENEKRTAAAVATAATTAASKTESKEDWKSYAALVVAIAAAVMAYLGRNT